MKIRINSREEIVPDGLSVLQYLEYKNHERKVAIWINGRQLLFSEYPAHILLENDDIKLIKIIGGG